MNTEQFVKRNKITMDCNGVDRNPNMMDDNWQAYHYQVTLYYQRRQLTTYFSTGIGWDHEPSAADVLDCLASDVAGYINARSFDEWCSEYGYDTDSRKAYHTYQTISRQERQLKQFMGAKYDDLLWNTDRM